jgi:Flp pilus assembly protein TadG
MRRRDPAHARHDDRGLSTLQLTIAAPVLIWWLMLIVQYGLWWHAKQVADGAAAEAVDVAQTPTGTAAAGETAARAFLGQAGNLDDISVIVERGTDVVRVQVQGDAPQLVPGWSWGVTARSQASVERFVPESERSGGSVSSGDGGGG